MQGEHQYFTILFIYVLIGSIYFLSNQGSVNMCHKKYKSVASCYHHKDSSVVGSCSSGTSSWEPLSMGQPPQETAPLVEITSATRRKYSKPHLQPVVKIDSECLKITTSPFYNPEIAIFSKR